MKNNTLSKVSIQSAKIPNSRFNFANDVSYTTQFGIVQPTHVKYMHSGSEKVVNDESLFYLANLVVPTFGRLKAKFYHTFVPFEDLLPKSFNSRLSGTPFSAPKVGSVIKTEKMPTIDLRLLSCFALLGSRMSIYYGASTNASTQAALTDPGDDVVVTALHLKENDNSNSPLGYAVQTNSYGIWNRAGGTSPNFSCFSSSQYNESSAWSSPGLNAFGVKCPTNTLLFDPCAFWSYPRSSSGKFLIPLGQQDIDSAYFDGIDVNTQRTYESLGQDTNFYNPQTGDVAIPKYFDYSYSVAGTTQWSRVRLYFVFHLSDYGKRFKSFIEGAGYKLHFARSRNVSFLPLLATYKAYYDLFSINLYENFENSDLGFVLSAIDAGAFHSNNDNVNLDLTTVNGVGATARLVKMFGEAFYTEEVDYLAAHIPNTGVSPSPSTGFIKADVVTTPNVSVVDSSVPSSVPNPPGNAHAYINSAIHGQLDAEFLKKAYRWVNRNTIAGQRIAELLRAQGLGDYVDTCKSNFIGYDETPLIIDDVISSTDTYDSVNGTGSKLGQRGAKGIGYNDGKKSFKFTANTIGFWVTFVTIVPSSGYCQGVDPVNAGLIDKNHFFIPDVDALGMEETDMHSIVDSPKSTLPVDYNLAGAGFGFVPQESRFKVARNKIMGSFSLASEEDDFLPYNMEKIIPYNKFICHERTWQTGYHYDSYKFFNRCDFDSIPTAGDAWRYIGKYLFLENFNRIFSYVGWSEKIVTATIGNNWSEFVVRDADNFIVHMIDNDQYYAPMKPIENSFGTDDDGRTNTAIEKA